MCIYIYSKAGYDLINFLNIKQINLDINQSKLAESSISLCYHLLPEFTSTQQCTENKLDSHINLTIISTKCVLAFDIK